MLIKASSLGKTPLQWVMIIYLAYCVCLLYDTLLMVCLSPLYPFIVNKPHTDVSFYSNSKQRCTKLVGDQQLLTPYAMSGKLKYNAV